MKILYLVNAAGLLFDIIGVLILAKFGLPPKVNREGTFAILTEKTDNVEIKKGKKYEKLSLLALGLIILGFVLQFTVCIKWAWF